MRTLSNEILTNGHIYRLIERTESKAIYSQHTKDGELVGYEVFKIRIGKQAVMPNGVEIPERELFPKENDFGITAFAIGCDYDRAIKRYNAL